MGNGQSRVGLNCILFKDNYMLLIQNQSEKKCGFMGHFEM